MDLVPSSLLIAGVPELLAEDAATLAPAVNANHVHLMKVAFVPTPGTTFDPTHEATFAGSAAKSAGTGAQSFYRDPDTGTWYVALKDPVGGWLWKCTAAPGAPETIYGVVVTDNADAVVLGSGLLTDPTVISAVDDAIIIGEIRYPMPGGGFGLAP